MKCCDVRSCLVLALLAILALACGQPTQAPAEPAAEMDTEVEADAPAAEVKYEAAPVAPATQPAQPRPSAPPRAAASPAPAPAQPAAPRYVTVDVPAGTQMELEVLDALSSGTNQVGDPVRARLTHDLYAGDRRVAPAGSEVTGTVIEVVPLKNFGGQPKIAMTFDNLVLPNGTSVPVAASLTQVGKKQAGRDAAKIGGAAAAGAIIGHQIDDDKGKVVGAILGGAAGTAAAAKTGKEIEIAAGSVVVVALESNVQVRVES